MFHKENSIQRGAKKKAMDVPLRKSDRKHLRQRVDLFFQCPGSPFAATPSTNNDGKDDDGTSAITDPQWKTLLDDIFLQGNLSSRTIPMNEKAWNMILYLKTPSSNDNNNNNDTSSGDTSITTWPYETSSQFVWMALEEKNKVVQETPTVALWAVLTNYFVQQKSKGDDSSSSSDWINAYTVQVPYPVSKFLCRGADLMRSGMRSLPTKVQGPPGGGNNAATGGKGGNKKKNSKKNNTANNSGMVAITVKGNPQPFAVGKVKDPTQPIGPETKGIGVEIWNCFGDDLWRHSTNTIDQLQGKNPNPIHQLLNVVIPVEGEGDAATTQTPSLPFDNGNYGNVGFSGGKFVLPLQQKDIDQDDDDDSDVEVHQPKTAWDEPGDNESGDSTKEKENKADEATSEEEPRKDTEAETSTEEDSTPSITPEEQFHNAVCQALVSLNNKDMPMLVSAFFAQHVKPTLAASPTGAIDLKSTKYKKFGTYIKEQVANDLLLVGPDKKNPKNNDPMACLIGYNKRHDDVQGLKKLPKAGGASSGGANGGEKRKLVLVNLFVFPQNWPKLLRLDNDDVQAANATSEERKGTGMLTTPEVRKILDGYIEREGLIPRGRPDQIQLDGPMTDVLYKKDPNPPSLILRKDIAKLFTSKLNKAYAIVQMPGSAIIKLGRGAPAKVEVEVQMRQSKKFVTRIRGLEDYNIDPQYFVKDVTKRLACSGSVETDPVGRAALKKGRVELVFQGNIVDELEAILTGDESLSTHGGVKNSNYCIPQKVVAITLRKGVPGRKRGGGGKRK